MINANPEYDPGFPEVHDESTIEDTRNPIGYVEHADAGKMHDETIGAIRAMSAGVARLIEVMSDVGKDTLQVNAGVTTSSHVRLRVRWIVISRATAGDALISIGTRTYTFTVGAVPVRVDFPLVIERGVDIAYAGDGRIYLISDPE